MLPLRISLQGFMSYRDATTFDFEGARLWMLSGDNGAGKSTVFDALRWVLFGAHRGGKINHTQLIHHESQKLMVEVELRLGEDVYKLRRTLGREGVRPTWDISRRVENSWEPVAGTNMARGYEKWVKERIGLTDEAFCASVYLSQGGADAILNADADARYDLLSQLVDLEVYERWYESAEEKRAEARATLQEARKRWETAPPPAPEQLAQLRERSAQLEIERAKWALQVGELESARADARRWEEWSGQLATLKVEAATYRALLEDEENIERDFARLQHLNSHRTAIDALWQSLKRRDELTQEVASFASRQAVAQREREESQRRADETQVEMREAEDARTKTSERWINCMNAAGQIAPQRASIERRAQLLEQRAQDEEKRNAFEDDLDARVEQTRSERDEAREAARVLPLWRRFAEAQRSYETALAHRGTWQKRHEEAVTSRDNIEKELVAARGALQDAEEQLRAAVTEVGAVNERARTLEQRRADFAQVEGEARCHFCGQELSPAHRVAELERLELAARTLRHEQEQVGNNCELARTVFGESEKEVAKLTNALAEVEQTLATTDAERRHQSSNMEREQSLAAKAWDELGIEARRALGVVETHFKDVFDEGVAHPSEDDFKRLKERGGRVAALESRVLQWEKRRRERERVDFDLERINDELAPLLAKWSDADVEAWQVRAQEVEAELQDAKKQQEESRERAERARTQYSEANTALGEARASVENFLRQLGPLRGELRAIESALEGSLTVWNTAIERNETQLPNLEEVELLREAWEHEADELQARDTNGRHRDIAVARTGLERVVRDQAFYESQIRSLPVIAHRLHAAVEAEWQESRAQFQGVEAEEVQVGDEVRRLEREARERITLEAEFHKRSQQFENWEELARLLGPHQLQRHLLRQAETAIVREANGVLEGISGGTLQLELVPDSDESGGNKRPKVLDVMCYHLSGGEEFRAVGPAFLSGSQRFRVAVALALGIGRTAARGSGGRVARVETILIDEGFGSLDKVGRDEMKDELRELGRELGRVILVSHQEDFARAFPNRFDISMQNGVSRVRKVVE